MEAVEIQIREKCVTCDGGGKVDNYLWQALYKEKGKDFTEEEMYEWFAKNGYYDKHNLPSEECGCSECEGEGKITRWISIEELHKLLRQVPVKRPRMYNYEAVQKQAIEKYPNMPELDAIRKLMEDFTGPVIAVPLTDTPQYTIGKCPNCKENGSIKTGNTMCDKCIAEMYDEEK